MCQDKEWEVDKKQQQVEEDNDVNAAQSEQYMKFFQGAKIDATLKHFK